MPTSCSDKNVPCISSVNITKESNRKYFLIPKQHLGKNMFAKIKKKNVNKKRIHPLESNSWN